MSESVSSPATATQASSPPTSRAGTPDPDALFAYHQLMSSLFPPSSLPRPPTPDIPTLGPDRHVDGPDRDTVLGENGESRAMTRAEKQNAKKKRRKERERAAKLEQDPLEGEECIVLGDEEKHDESVVDFRLFSSCPIRPVSLLPVPEEYPIPINPKYLPLSDAVTSRIRSVAAESAASIPSLGESSQTSSAPGRELYLECGPDQGLPDMFIGVIKSSVESFNIHTPQSTKRAKRIPALPLSSTNPSVPSSTPSTTTKRTRRGRRKTSTNGDPAPRFWAPPRGLGGKARGYAWGYRDSMEGRRERGGWAGYLRNK